MIIRSFGKFYGLAGLRLGFIIGGEAEIARLAAMVGPWPISGAAIAIGKRAVTFLQAIIASLFGRALINANAAAAHFMHHR